MDTIQKLLCEPSDVDTFFDVVKFYKKFYDHDAVARIWVDDGLLHVSLIGEDGKLKISGTEAMLFVHIPTSASNISIDFKLKGLVTMAGIRRHNQSSNIFFIPHNDRDVHDYLELRQPLVSYRTKAVTVEDDECGHCDFKLPDDFVDRMIHKFTNDELKIACTKMLFDFSSKYNEAPELFVIDPNGYGKVGLVDQKNLPKLHVTSAMPTNTKIEKQVILSMYFYMFVCSIFKFTDVELFVYAILDENTNTIDKYAVFKFDKIAIMQGVHNFAFKGQPPVDLLRFFNKKR